MHGHSNGCSNPPCTQPDRCTRSCARSTPPSASAPRTSTWRCVCWALVGWLAGSEHVGKADAVERSGRGDLQTAAGEEVARASRRAASRQAAISADTHPPPPPPPPPHLSARAGRGVPAALARVQARRRDPLQRHPHPPGRHEHPL